MMNEAAGRSAGPLPPVREIIEAELTWTDGAFRRGVQVHVAEDGRIASAGPASAAATRRLPGRALLPGFVNAHSHAFQRALRGRGESYPAGGGDFWSWREAMYALVEEMDETAMRRVCGQALREMLAGGFTTVGEFHYLHHRDFAAADFAFDRVLIEAAAEAGIRLVLLLCHYRTGAIGRPLGPGQRRFDTRGVDAFLRQLDALSGRIDARTQSLGIAPHSIRAVPADEVELLWREAAARGLVVHMHVEEQAREIDECRAALGTNPLAWLLDHVAVDGRSTIVHATHSTPADLRRYTALGGNICVCPITEGNLGDGLGDGEAMLSRRDAVCIGTDSNVRIDALEELRWLEFVQRLRGRRRGVHKTAAGEVAAQLLASGTEHGARSLGVPAGRIAAGRLADFVVVDLGHPALLDATDETLAGMLALGAGADCVSEVCVGGAWRSVRSGGVMPAEGPGADAA